MNVGTDSEILTEYCFNRGFACFRILFVYSTMVTYQFGKTSGHFYSKLNGRTCGKLFIYSSTYLAKSFVITILNEIYDFFIKKKSNATDI